MLRGKNTGLTFKPIQTKRKKVTKNARENETHNQLKIGFHCVLTCWNHKDSKRGNYLASPAGAYIVFWYARRRRDATRRGRRWMLAWVTNLCLPFHQDCGLQSRRCCRKRKAASLRQKFWKFYNGTLNCICRLINELMW